MHVFVRYYLAQNPIAMRPHMGRHMGKLSPWTSHFTMGIITISTLIYLTLIEQRDHEVLFTIQIAKAILSPSLSLSHSRSLSLSLSHQSLLFASAFRLRFARVS